jgi:hypothetical protein
MDDQRISGEYFRIQLRFLAGFEAIQLLFALFALFAPVYP